jgi:hypothetical protein
MSAPIKVRILKDVEIKGSKHYAGGWVELYLGNNITCEEIMKLVDEGSIDFGVDKDEELAN